MDEFCWRAKFRTLYKIAVQAKCQLNTSVDCFCVAVVQQSRTVIFYSTQHVMT